MERIKLNVELFDSMINQQQSELCILVSGLGLVCLNLN